MLVTDIHDRPAVWAPAKHRNSDSIMSHQTCSLPVLQPYIVLPSPSPHPSSDSHRDAVHHQRCAAADVHVYCLQTYTAVTDARNSDAYAYALNYEYLMASVRSVLSCVPIRQHCQLQKAKDFEHVHRPRSDACCCVEIPIHDRLRAILVLLPHATVSAKRLCGSLVGAVCAVLLVPLVPLETAVSLRSSTRAPRTARTSRWRCAAGRRG